MSMIGHIFYIKLFYERGVTDPGEILNNPAQGCEEALART